MDQKKIDRINELYRKSKTEGLTDAEREEQQQLRTEYRMSVMNNLTGTLHNVSVKNPDGTITKLEPKGN